jgi:meso-butanediol dehydrogenase/(S,S)-butanediol dehydrogenase/diacetyl reductase
MDPLCQLLQDKVAIVTGVTSGLGEGIARVFSARGARVAGVARRIDRGRKLESEIGNFLFIAGDVARVADCERVVSETLKKFGRIDILINNAGSSGTRKVTPTHELDEKEWDQIVDVNLKGAVFMSRYALPTMRERRNGVIINIASNAAVIGLANMTAYNASKAGLVQASQTMAVENLEHGVRVFSILLGSVASEMSDNTALAFARHLRGPDWTPTLKLSDSGVLWRGEDVARTLSLLCHDDAKTITGTTIAIDQGGAAGAFASQFMYMASAELLPITPAK